MFDGAGFSEPSTKQAATALGKWGPKPPTLVVTGSEEEPAAKRFRNIEGVSVALASAAGVADVIGASSLLVSEEALKELASRIGERPSRGSARAKSGEVGGES